jgi:UDP-N-acetyl-D-mannosaminuronic acid dehydrogenase
MPSPDPAVQVNSARIAVVGLGYVGLTLATALAEVGFRVFGIEKRQHIADLTNEGIPHFFEPGLEQTLKEQIRRGALSAHVRLPKEEPCDVYVITVGTPLSSEGHARLDMIQAATNEVADHMQNGALVILRSTVRIGTSRHIVKQILDDSGKVADLAMCPERTLEGKAMQELRALPQVIGADEESTRHRAAMIFRRLTNITVEVHSLETAEIIKLVDNTYRDVQFGFANEVARLCDAWGVNSHEVIMSGKLGYPRTNVPLPGLVGGPCLEKDPHILAESARLKGISLEITQAARLVNERQPAETVEHMLRVLSDRGVKVPYRVTILGIAFKGVPATDDTRGSMGLRVISELRRTFPEFTLTVFDAVVPPDAIRDSLPDCQISDTVRSASSGADLVIIANNHPANSQLTLSELRNAISPHGLIYDFWNHYSHLSREDWGSLYFAVGNTNGRRGV